MQVIKRVHIPKGDGKDARPLGRLSVNDKRYLERNLSDEIDDFFSK